MRPEYIVYLFLATFVLFKSSDAWGGFRFPRIHFPRIPPVPIDPLKELEKGVKHVVSEVNQIVKNTVKNTEHLIKDTTKIVEETIENTANDFKKVIENPPCLIQLCGPSCSESGNGGSVCKWYCNNTCNVFGHNKIKPEFNWVGKTFYMPCTFKAYDKNNDGMKPWELSPVVNVNPSGSNNMMMFKRLDKNGDGTVSEEEFNKPKDLILLTNCKNTN